MFSTTCHGKSLDVFVDCDTFNTGGYYKGIPYLDVSSVYSEETNTVIINVVNRHKDEAIETVIISNSGNFAGKATAKEIYREDIKEMYTYEKREEYIPAPKEISTRKSKIIYSFPPHSFTQIIAGLAGD